MPSRNTQAGNPVKLVNGLLGYPTTVSLVTAAGGTAQNGYLAPTDVVIVTAADASNTAVTMKDAAVLEWQAGDSYEFVNGSAQACVIFPPTGGIINGGSANASIALAANKAVKVYVTDVTSGANKWTAQLGA